MDLIRPVLGGGFGLVGSTEVSVISLIQELRLDGGQLSLANLLEDNGQRGLGAGEGRREGHVKDDSLGFERLGSAQGLFTTQFRECRISPPSEQVLSMHESVS